MLVKFLGPRGQSPGVEKENASYLNCRRHSRVVILNSSRIVYMTMRKMECCVT